jgi:polyhydroxyalkanoate synthesis regulator phasin
VGGVSEQINKRVDELVKAGNTQAEATNKALDEISKVTGKSIEDLRAQVGSVKDQIDTRIDEYIAIGFDREEAQNAAIKKYADDNNVAIKTVKDALEEEIKTTRTDITGEINTRFTDMALAELLRGATPSAGAGGGGGASTPVQQPQGAPGMYSVGTEKAGLADIGSQYDLNATLLDNIMRILSGEDDNAGYYGGGSVNGYNATDELIKLLRG